MQSLDQLRVEAREACGLRGHIMRFTPPWHGEYGSLQSGECTKCGMRVHLNTRPLPNGIDIGGEAVALNCNHGE